MTFVLFPAQRCQLLAVERYTVHLRAICPEGAGRFASHGVRRRLNVMATLTVALVRCYG
jgi:hypothetical protein